MKILVLEHPRLPSQAHFNDIANTPLWSCLMGGYAAAALAASGRDEVVYLDAAGRGLSFDAAETAVLTHAADLLCINAVYFWEPTPALFAFLERLRPHGFCGHLNLFGFFPTQVSCEILAGCDAVDSVAVGECEATLVDLAAWLRGGRRGQAPAGLARREFGVPVPAVRRPPLRDPDRLPFPVRDPAARGAVSVLASRGCYNHCTFCPIPGFYNGGPLWRGRSPENVAAEITTLAEAGRRAFYFVDPNFVGPGRKGRDRAMTLARLLAPLSITFGMETRPEDLSAELLAALCRAGLTGLLLGVESGSAAQLEAIHKRQAPQAAERAIALCRQAGVEPEIGFILFLADAGLADIRAGADFLRRNQLLDRLDRTVNVLSHCQIVFKGTPAYRRYREQGRLAPAGCFGYQGRVAFADPRVAWLAAAWLPVCRHVLRAMARVASPIFHGTPATGVAERVNRELTAIFDILLETASEARRLPAVEALQADLLARIGRCIGEAPSQGDGADSGS